MNRCWWFFHETQLVVSHYYCAIYRSCKELFSAAKSLKPDDLMSSNFVFKYHQNNLSCNDFLFLMAFLKSQNWGEERFLVHCDEFDLFKINMWNEVGGKAAALLFLLSHIGWVDDLRRQWKKPLPKYQQVVRSWKVAGCWLLRESSLPGVGLLLRNATRKERSLLQLKRGESPGFPFVGDMFRLKTLSFGQGVC